MFYELWLTGFGWLTVCPVVLVGWLIVERHVSIITAQYLYITRFCWCAPLMERWDNLSNHKNTYFHYWNFFHVLCVFLRFSILFSTRATTLPHFKLTLALTFAPWKQNAMAKKLKYDTIRDELHTNNSVKWRGFIGPNKVEQINYCPHIHRRRFIDS